MAKENCQKIKLLKLMEILHQDTDEQHPLLATEVCQKLVSQGITCDRRTLTKDIRLLNEQGYEIMSKMVSHEKAYYIEDRGFSIPELKILIDAVQSTSFITTKKTTELTEKIASLGGSHCADILKRNMVCFNSKKHSNESIYYNVNFLEDAIKQQKKAAFRYFDLDADGIKMYRKYGSSYVIEPIAMVFSEDNYYLIGYNDHYDNTANYRIDKMDAVNVLDESISEKAISLRQNVSDYTEQVFKMYGGPAENITIRFNSKLIGAVYDKFGENTKMIPMGDNDYAATVKVQVSPTFWGWIFQFTDQMTIISPDSVIQQYREQLDKVARIL